LEELDEDDLDPLPLARAVEFVSRRLSSVREWRVDSESRLEDLEVEPLETDGGLDVVLFMFDVDSEELLSFADALPLVLFRSPFGKGFLAVILPFITFEDCSDAVVVGEPDLDVDEELAEDDWLDCFEDEDDVVAESGFEGCLKSALVLFCFDSDLEEPLDLLESDLDAGGVTVSLRWNLDSSTI